MTTVPVAFAPHQGVHAGMVEVAATLVEHHLWDHHPGLVFLASLICVAGCFVTIKLFQRAALADGMQKLGWLVLTSVAAGAAIWCTHFIAMLGFDPGVPFTFEPTLTIISLIIAVAGTMGGLWLAISRKDRFAPLFGGALFGLAVAAIHYTGMMGYQVRGVVQWDLGALVASLGFAMLFGAAAVRHALRRTTLRGHLEATGLMVLGILLLHFTGMVAYQVIPVGITGGGTDPEQLMSLALAVACVGFVIFGAGSASYIIDEKVRSDSYEQLRQMAVTDSLTGLPNRMNFNVRLEEELSRATTLGTRVALVGIDLDRFKEINDVHGHAMGDAVLKALAARITGDLREGEFVARLGGDEFAALKRLDAVGQVNDFLARLERALHAPLRIDRLEVSPGASLGVSVYPDDAGDKLSLIGNADLAMYRAKATPNSSVAFYDPSMDEIVRKRKALANDLRSAFDRNELDVHFQVQKSICGQKIQGYEALVRWTHPERGPISPAEFIPIAEENGLILQLGEWVLRQACRRAARWDPPYKVAVNVSPMQFAHADLPKLILEILVETGLPANRLELELTESTIFADKERSLHMLRQIKALGITIALDDFGTGYSSLDTLRTFPFDKIKLDRSFIEQVDTSEQTVAMVRAVLALGRSLRIPVLAEGIETDEQLTLLEVEGCDEVQGFLLGRPMPVSSIVEKGELVLKPEVMPQPRPAASVKPEMAAKKVRA
ncbi:putative bifunctional diguanylate cyclase/phosphodiesterase [Hyphomonas sp.]|uniref:putative bifunctional diguanylate cyclase/phosphodiesterase n=1 Tax=Hyphomonas sp. TaxID=87 RepID=UPI00391BF108